MESAADHLWQSTVVAGTAWLLARALQRNRAQIRYLVWLAASVKFIVPFAVVAAVIRSINWRPFPVDNVPAIPIGFDVVSQPFMQVWDAAPTSEMVTGSGTALFAFVALLWVTGVLTHLTRWAMNVGESLPSSGARPSSRPDAWLPSCADAVPLRLTLPLSSLDPGRYDCQVSVLDTNGRKAAFWRAPIVVVP